MSTFLLANRDAFSFVTDTAREIGFSGVIALYEQGEQVYHRAFGLRDIPNRVPNDTATRFGIASGTKLFTALGILKLVENGVIDLESRAATVFGDAGVSFIDPEATIEQLLCHRSGIFDYYDEETIEDFDNFSVAIPWYKLTAPSDYLPLFETKSAKFAAGSRTAYSNGGYVFLGVLIEKLTGRTYRDFIEQEVLLPLGMARSGFFAFNQLPENTAFGYLEAAGESPRTNIYQLPARGAGDGGMYSTADDMYSCWTGLFNGKLLEPETLELMTRKHSRMWDKVDYGLGVYIGEQASLPYCSIMGSDAGVGFSSRYIPKLRVQVSVLSNRTDGNVPVMRELVQRIGQVISGAA